jgi:hypothetical protein
VSTGRISETVLVGFFRVSNFEFCLIGRDLYECDLSEFGKKCVGDLIPLCSCYPLLCPVIHVNPIECCQIHSLGTSLLISPPVSGLSDLSYLPMMHRKNLVFNTVRSQKFQLCSANAPCRHRQVRGQIYSVLSSERSLSYGNAAKSGS